jgi:hypothetical protein
MATLESMTRRQGWTFLMERVEMDNNGDYIYYIIYIVYVCVYNIYISYIRNVIY